MKSDQLEPIAVRASEAARLLGISKPKLYELTHRADFTAAFKCGGCMMFSVEGLRAWVAEQTGQQSNEEGLHHGTAPRSNVLF